ncbi:MAG: hypothetical protein H0X43_13745 [Nitrosospira sp.]|nr:hypothetical protein [Nitrosospira sp.]
MQIIRRLLPLVLLLSVNTQAEENATYVGGGRYACDSDTVDCGVLKQRNEERERKAQDRDEDERRYERAERRDADDKLEYGSGRY